MQSFVLCLRVAKVMINWQYISKKGSFFTLNCPIRRECNLFFYEKGWISCEPPIFSFVPCWFFMTTCRFFIAPCQGYAYVPVTQWGDSDRFTWGIQVLSAEDFSPFDALSLQNYEKRFAFFYAHCLTSLRSYPPPAIKAKINDNEL